MRYIPGHISWPHFLATFPGHHTHMFAKVANDRHDLPNDRHDLPNDRHDLPLCTKPDLLSLLSSLGSKKKRCTNRSRKSKKEPKKAAPKGQRKQKTRHRKWKNKLYFAAACCNPLCTKPDLFSLLSSLGSKKRRCTNRSRKSKKAAPKGQRKQEIKRIP